MGCYDALTAVAIGGAAGPRRRLPLAAARRVRREARGSFGAAPTAAGVLPNRAGSVAGARAHHVGGDGAGHPGLAPRAVGRVLAEAGGATVADSGCWWQQRDGRPLSNPTCVSSLWLRTWWRRAGRRRFAAARRVRGEAGGPGGAAAAAEPHADASALRNQRDGISLAEPKRWNQPCGTKEMTCASVRQCCSSLWCPEVPMPCGTTGINLWQNGSRSARTGSVSRRRTCTRSSRCALRLHRRVLVATAAQSRPCQCQCQCHRRQWRAVSHRRQWCPRAVAVFPCQALAALAGCWCRCRCSETDPVRPPEQRSSQQTGDQRDDQNCLTYLHVFYLMRFC